MFPTLKEALPMDRKLLRTLQAMSAIRPWIVFVALFTSCSLAVAADSPARSPQIQGTNLRVEFDTHRGSRLFARFDNKEMVLGPFTASETLTTAGKVWTEF